jgi:hypothetical protein
MRVGVFGAGWGGTDVAPGRGVAFKPIARIRKPPVLPVVEIDATREWDGEPTIDESATFESETPTERYPWRHISTFSGSLTPRARN